MKKKVLLMVAAILVLASCSKYEEGPALSLRSKTSRLCGSWKLSELYVNGALQENTANTRWEIQKDGNCSRISTDPYTQSDYTTSGTWALNEDKTQLDFQWYIIPLDTTMSESWTILKLKEKALWLEIVSYGSVSECRFVQ